MRAKVDQTRTPIFTALKQYVNDGVLPFHVPGHKQGRALAELKEYVGEKVLAMDLTCMPDLDNICNPRSVIREAEELTAAAYGADYAFFLVNGTTSGIQAMILALCKPGDKIIIPRNAHRSALGGLILSGARPVYIEPEINSDYGISMGVTPERVEWALKEHPDAKAVFIISPNYYGTLPPLADIVKVAHRYDVPVLVDEAHGAHLKFHPALPLSSMEAGADLAAVSAHKLAGSLTQSSFLLAKGHRIDPKHLKAVLNISQTTSPSYILLASLDVARKQMALHGRELLDRTLEIAGWIRQELTRIEGLRVLGKEVIGLPGCSDLDPTKITVNVQELGLSGYEMENLLRQQYGIQVELSDLYNVLLLISIGDDWEMAGRLVEAFRDIARRRSPKNVVRFCPPLPAIPRMLVSPREAFYSQTHSIELEYAEGEISAEAITAYPPGIPLICPGEIITREVIDYVNLLKKEHADLQGPEDPELKYIRVLKDTVSMVERETVSRAGGLA
ncbi:aminotransferase class I/II-fold pyridoxal phosphate-dependent enzyme [Thermanaeromonas sp. C210]|uniref:aminotransferase class I/II-fold pyridoxal phosphate-dependent enzyme n=1 Tax=Thermanaeromonas sp. C210 TaxID=2731925 RepID=UPI00155CCA65|nr:aminotransferase class I/II-fold pyridoxal phosphate-dependent enzyme [Thermanaeromonas sp. C210]GFN21917.1 arginine decarboxylase [Thermanaeromonas sp. C210]